ILHSKARRSWNRSSPTGEPGSWLPRKATRMTSTPIELGTLLDGWAASARVSVVETAPAVTVSRLDAASTQELLAATHRLGWDCDVQDQAGEPALTEDIEEALGPFVATIQKIGRASCRERVCQYV